MQKNKFIFGLISILILMISCQDIEQKKLIIGEWGCIDWKVKGVSKTNPEAKFVFGEDGRYQYQVNSLKENGNYKVQGGKLYSTPDNELEIAVDIMKLTTDTLEFNMSRAGVPETMLLIKVQ